MESKDKSKALKEITLNKISEDSLFLGDLQFWVSTPSAHVNAQQPGIFHSPEVR